MGEERDAYMFLMGKPGEHWKDLEVGGRIILKWILEK
jgi:hypothetical protein